MTFSAVRQSTSASWACFSLCRASFRSSSLCRDCSVTLSTCCRNFTMSRSKSCRVLSSNTVNMRCFYVSDILSFCSHIHSNDKHNAAGQWCYSRRHTSQWQQFYTDAIVSKMPTYYLCITYLVTRTKVCLNCPHFTDPVLWFPQQRHPTVKFCRLCHVKTWQQTVYWEHVIINIFNYDCIILCRIASS